MLKDGLERICQVRARESPEIKPSESVEAAPVDEANVAAKKVEKIVESLMQKIEQIPKVVEFPSAPWDQCWGVGFDKTRRKQKRAVWLQPYRKIPGYRLYLSNLDGNGKVSNRLMLKVTPEGIFDKDQKISIAKVVTHVKEYLKARGWS